MPSMIALGMRLPLQSIRPLRVPDAVQRAALAERCTAGPGPVQTPESGTVTVLQRTTKRCCAAPGTGCETSIRVTRLAFDLAAGARVGDQRREGVERSLGGVG